MNGDDGDIRVQLVRMEGTLNVANERLGSMKDDIADIRRTQSSHSDRLGLLEAARNRSDGEHTGRARTGEIIWRVVSFLAGSGGVLTAVEFLK